LEWDRLFTARDYMREIRSFAMCGKLRSCRFRSICWKVQNFMWWSLSW